MAELTHIPPQETPGKILFWAFCEAIEARQCAQCERDAGYRAGLPGESCPILAAVVGWPGRGPGYTPPEWRHGPDGPICAAFVPEGEPLPPEVSPDQMALPIGEVACRC